MENDDQLKRESDEDLIDDAGRNPTQQRMDAEGVESRPVDVEQDATDMGGPDTDPERPTSRVVDTDDAMQARQGDVGHDPIAASDEDVGDVIA